VEEPGGYQVGGSLIPLDRFLLARYGEAPREELERRIGEFGSGKYNGVFLRTRGREQLVSILARLMEEGAGCASVRADRR